MGPLRRLRRHLPLKGEDCENDHVLPLQGEVAAKRSEGALSESSPFRHLPPKWVDCENAHVLPIQGEAAAKRSEGATQSPRL